MPEPSRNNADPELSGQKLGNYQLLRRLGRGGMADVYLAEQLSLRRQVAFKVLKKTLAEDEAYVRRFHHEARAAASLVHANIVQIHEVGCIDGTHFIAQEYVPGQNLKQWLSRHGTADAATAVHVMRQVMAALGRAARHGIIHRDIKPENIMLATTGEVKVADFGLARMVTEGQAVDLTQVGITMGTPLYMSPEQVEGRGVDPRSDLYSFGVTCYEMLAGRPPFEGDSPLSVAVQHLRAEPTRLEALRPDLPEGLCRIVHRLLAKVPDERYATAADAMRRVAHGARGRIGAMVSLRRGVGYSRVTGTVGRSLRGHVAVGRHHEVPGTLAESPPARLADSPADCQRPAAGRRPGLVDETA